MDGQVLISKQIVPCIDSAHSHNCEHVIHVENLERVVCNVVPVGDPRDGCLSVRNTDNKQGFRRPRRTRTVIPDCVAVVFLTAQTVRFSGSL